MKRYDVAMNFDSPTMVETPDGGYVHAEEAVALAKEVEMLRALLRFADARINHLVATAERQRDALEVEALSC